MSATVVLAKPNCRNSRSATSIMRSRVSSGLVFGRAFMALRRGFVTNDEIDNSSVDVCQPPPFGRHYWGPLKARTGKSKERRFGAGAGTPSPNNRLIAVRAIRTGRSGSGDSGGTRALHSYCAAIASPPAGAFHSAVCRNCHRLRARLARSSACSAQTRGSLRSTKSPMLPQVFSGSCSISSYLKNRLETFWFNALCHSGRSRPGNDRRNV